MLTLDGLASWIQGEVSPHETQQEAYDNFMALAEEMTEAEARKEPQERDTDRSTAKELAEATLGNNEEMKQCKRAEAKIILNVGATNAHHVVKYRQLC